MMMKEEVTILGKSLFYRDDFDKKGYVWFFSYLCDPKITRPKMAIFGLGG